MPADTIFKQNLTKYDVILGMYHDQVLAPIKALNGFDAINLTLGLPFIRFLLTMGQIQVCLARTNLALKA